MFIHVVPKSQLRHKTGVLTYRTSQPVVVGQLVTVLLRGRRIPGLVVKINTSADTTANIQPINSVGSVILPLSFLNLIEAVANYYCLNQARAWYLLASTVNSSYLHTNLKRDEQAQHLYLTPSAWTPLAQKLATRGETVPKDAAPRRQQWQRAASGQSITVSGTTAAASLPFASLKSLTLDTPLASPYTNERAPGISAAVIALLQAKLQSAKTTIRTTVPKSELAKLLPLPANAKIINPRLHSITVWPQKGKGYLNEPLLADIKEKVARYRRVLIYYNALTHLDPKGVLRGQQSLVSELRKKTGHQTVAWHKGDVPKIAPLTVATATALYGSATNFGYTYILSLEQLVSSLRPYSPLEALEVLGVLASRTPLTLQYQDFDFWLVKIAADQLKVKTSLPTFSKRLLAFRRRKETNHDQKIIAQIKTLWPKHLVSQEDKLQITVLSPFDLTNEQSTFIHTVSSNWSVKTRANTLPNHVSTDKVVN